MRRTNLLFEAGGESLQRHGTFVWKRSRGEDNGYTHTRSGTIAKALNSDGVLYDYAANVPRANWLDLDGDGILETPALLLEAARTNVITSDVLSAWTAVNSPFITGTITDPAGGSDAYNVEDDSATLNEHITRTITVAGGAPSVRSFVAVVREGGTTPANGSAINWNDVNEATVRGQLRITGWTNGEPTASAGTAGTYLGKRKLGNGYWALYMQTDANCDGDNTNELQIRPAWSNSETGDLDVYRVNAFDAVVPSYSILDQSETRNAEVLYADFPYPPQEMTVYVKFIEAGTKDVADGGLVFFGGTSATTDPRLSLQSNGAGEYQLVHDNGTTTVTATLAAGPSWGDTVEIRATLADNASFPGWTALEQSINGAAATAASSGAGATVQAAWAGTRCYIGSRVGADRGMNPIISVKIARGDRTMAEMRAL